MIMSYWIVGAMWGGHDDQLEIFVRSRLCAKRMAAESARCEDKVLRLMPKSL
ncbi:MAG: hypothetical protein WBW93_11015 [Steroidobacteraceae bacterium]